MTATTTCARPGAVVPGPVRGLGAEVLAVPGAVRAAWAAAGVRGRRRVRRVSFGAVVLAVVVACTGAWWDPAIDAVFNGIGQWISKAVLDAVSEAAVLLMGLAFNNPLTEISDAQWDVATRQAARWGAVFAVVAVAACAVEVIAAVIVRDTTRVLRAGVIAALAWPMTVAAILVLAEVVKITDGLSGQMFANVAGEGAAGAAAASTAMGAALGGLTAITFSAGWVLVVIGAMVCLIGLVMIAMVMAARAFGLVVAAGFAPTALMLVGFKGTRSMAGKWVEIVVALLLTKPLAAGIVVLCLELTGAGTLESFIMGTVGLWVAVFSPALAMSLVSFAGGHLTAALTAHSSALKGLGAQASQAGATRMALEGPNKEALSKLGSQAADAARAAGSFFGGLGKRLGAGGSGEEQDGPEPQDGDAPEPPTPETGEDGTTEPGQPPAENDGDAPGPGTPDGTEPSDVPGPTDAPTEVPDGSPDGSDRSDGEPTLEVPEPTPGPDESGGGPGSPVPTPSGSADARQPGGPGPGGPGSSESPGPGTGGGGGGPMPTDSDRTPPRAPGPTAPTGGGSGEQPSGSTGDGHAPVPATSPPPRPVVRPSGPGAGGPGAQGPNPFGGR